MIYTVTFNPSLDYFVRAGNFKMGETNRTSGEYICPGGKGVNVAIVLKNLGLEVCALGFKAGFTGEAIENMVKAEGVKTDFIGTEGLSRVNIKLKTHEETEINGSGAKISLEAVDMLIDKLKAAEEGSYVVLAGSVPDSLPKDIYGQIMFSLRDKNFNFIVDSTGDLLVNVLPYKPFLIKPNCREIGEIFNMELKNSAEIAECAKKVREMGARNVIVSMAGEGAYMLTEKGEAYSTLPPKGKAVDSVGAGDSLVAGFLFGWEEKHDYRYALLRGVATGSATAFKRGLATKEESDDLLKTLL